MSKIDRLKNKLQNKEFLVLDGATGTELQHRGVKTTLPLWSAPAIFSHPDVLKQIHIDYILSGADIIITNTFRTTSRTYAKTREKDMSRDATLQACRIAIQAMKDSGTKKDIFIAGSVAPLEDCYSPELTPTEAELQAEHLKYAQNLKDGGVDFLLIETMITIRETLAALEAAKKINIPAAVCFCCTKDGKLLSREDLSATIEKIKRYDPLFIGINCLYAGFVPALIKKIKSVTDLPICVYAQGDGQPADLEAWKFTGPAGAQWYLAHAKKWKKLGAQIIGGCCGTSPEYISLISKSL